MYMRSSSRGVQKLLIAIIILLGIQHATASLGDHLPEFRECVKVGVPVGVSR